MKKVKLGIIGLGKLGIRHAYNIAFRIPNAELAAACSVIPGEIDYVRNSWGLEHCYDSYEALLDHPGLDGVAIISPSKLHCAQVSQALERGLHVFCEKPLGIDGAELDAIDRVAAAHTGQVLMLAYMRRFDPSYLDAKAKIDSGEIGEVIMVKCHGSDPTYAWPGDSLYQYSLGSGDLFIDMAVHDFDLARWLLGCEPESVYAMGGAYVFRELQEIGGIDNAGIAMRFQHGRMALFHAGRTAPGSYRVETEVVGTKGVVKVSPVSARNLNVVYDEYGVRRETGNWFQDRFDAAYLGEMQAFADCVQQGGPPPVNAFDGRQATCMANAARESFLTDAVVKL